MPIRNSRPRFPDIRCPYCGWVGEVPSDINCPKCRGDLSAWEELIVRTLHKSTSQPKRKEDK